MKKILRQLLPSDLLLYAAQKRRRRYFRCLFPFCLLLVVGAFQIAKYHSYFFGASIAKQFFFISFYLVGISLLTGFPSALWDRSYLGEIQAVWFRDGFDAKQMLRGEGGIYNRRNYRVWTTAEIALLGKEKTVTKNLATRSLVGFHSSEHYTKGRLVLYLDGFEIPYVFPEDPADFGVCMLCGLANTSDAKACHHCQHTLLQKTAFEFRKEYEFVAIHKYRR